MIPLHIICSRSEMIFLRRLDLKSLFYDWIMTILTENALNLRRSRAAMLEARICTEATGAWICGDLPGSAFNLGVMKFSGWNFGGCVIERNIGSKNKKDFLATTQRAGEQSFIFEEGFLSPKTEEFISV